jgi:hypothetical protein
MGSRELAAAFRKMEIELNGSKKIAPAQVRQVRMLLGRLRKLIYEIEHYSIS